MARKLLAGTGWKMNKTAMEARAYVADLLPLLGNINFNCVDVFLLPPFTSLTAVSSLLENTHVTFGAQNMHWETCGAWTGEVSAPMLVEAGCRYVELGHSERRSYFNETDESVNRKVLTALEYGLIPIICVGETLEEQGNGRTHAVLGSQIFTALQNVASRAVPAVILAYEPRWAIGQKEAASPDYIQGIHYFIRERLADRYGHDAARQMPIIYGGSVALDNAAEIVAQTDVDGLFIGRTALDPQNFARLVKTVEDEAVRRSA